MSDEIKQNIKKKSTWLRGLYMLLFLIFYSVAKVIIFTVITFQFVLSLLTGKTNDRLSKVGTKPKYLYLPDYDFSYF